MAAHAKWSGKAIASLLLGLFSWLWLLNYFTGAAAILLGIKALQDIRVRHRQSGKFLAVAGILLGLLPYYVSAIYLLRKIPGLPAGTLAIIIAALLPSVVAVTLVILRKRKLI